jgi:hypothetical protein
MVERWRPATPNASIITDENYLLERNTRDQAAADSEVDYGIFPSNLSSRESAVLGRAIKNGSSDPGDAESTAKYLLSGDSLEERSAFLKNAFDDENTASRIADRMDEEAGANTVGTISESERIANRMDAEAGANTVGKSGARTNPLDEYTNYTYGLTMRALSIAAYNGGDYNGKVLVASAGRRGNGYERSQSFHEDFYFDTFKMSGVIGLNSRSRSSNVITLDFNIVEPYGITFLNRLLAVAKELGVQSWHEMPFVMQIDFYGNDDNGVPINPIPGQSKIIPFKLIACNIKASSRGSEYQCSAVPFNHQVFRESVASVPAIFEMRAKTVGDFFSDQDKEGSFTTALNNYNKKLAEKSGKSEKSQELYDEYAFELGEGLADALIVANDKVSTSRIPMASKNNKDATDAQGAAAAKGGKPVTVDLSTQLITINAGTSIIDVINLVLRNSNYVIDQLEPGGGKPINWFKIIPKVELKKFDKIRKVYQKKITYSIIKSTYYNTKYPGAPIALPSKWAKEYNYMYTGLNQSILDFNIDFDTMFYTVMTASRLKETATEVYAGEEEIPETVDNDTQDNGIAPLRLGFVAAQTDVTSKEGNNDEKSVAAGDMYKSMMSSSRGDMINIKITISGDPEFIKQDDFYITDSTDEIVNGSIASDTAEVFVYLTFRSPSDLIQETGLMDFTTYKDTVFSGIYKVITIDTIFERGQFKQILDLVRMFDQQKDLSSGSGGGGNKTPNQRITVPSGAAEMANALAIDEASRLMDGAKIIPATGPDSAWVKAGGTETGGGAATGNPTMTNQTRLGNPNINPGSLRDRAAQANAAREEQAARNTPTQPYNSARDSQGAYDGMNNESEIQRLANRANAARLSRVNDKEPIPVNILGPDTFGP